MFAERKVDIELLKERQRGFIARLANAETLKEDHSEVQQARERHYFGINPERAVSWINRMEETMVEIELAEDIRETLLEKMRFLIHRMTEKAKGE